MRIRSTAPWALFGIACSLWSCSGAETDPLGPGVVGASGAASSSGGATSTGGAANGGSTPGSTNSGAASGAALGGNLGLAGASGSPSGGSTGLGGSAGTATPSGGSLNVAGSGGRSSGGNAGESSGGSAGASSGGTAGNNTAGGNTAGGNTAGRGNLGGAAGAAGATANGGSASGGSASGGAGTGPNGAVCPHRGNVTYTLARSANPTAAEQDAYTRITAALDKAIQYYNCYTDITKKLNVSYVPSVQTADGNINGSMRFGSNTTYMDYRTAMHEIGHTVGIGQASNWASFITADKIFTGENASAELRAINASLPSPSGDGKVHADNQHFWPYGINQQSEVKSEADLLFHCRMVMAIRKDLGLK